MITTHILTMLHQFLTCSWSISQSQTDWHTDSHIWTDTAKI